MTPSGENMSNLSVSLHEIQVGVTAATWANFPLTLREAAGGKIGQTLFAGLGTAGSAWYGLDLANADAGWQRKADFPGPVPGGAAFCVSGSRLYVFGGVVRDLATNGIYQSEKIWFYDAQLNSWDCLPHCYPLDFLGANAVTVSDHQIWLFGGYSKAQFDQLCAALQAAGSLETRSGVLQAFMSRPTDAYQWNCRVFEFDIRTHEVRAIAQLPQTARCGAGLIRDRSQISLIGGEIKPGLRSNTIVRLSLGTGQPQLQGQENLAPASAAARDGLAVPFAGMCNGIPLIAGGTQFAGASADYAAGQLYAHKDKSKQWLNEIHAFIDGQWRPAGCLPAARAHGLSFELERGLLMVGGDAQNGEPQPQSWLLSFQLIA